MEEQSNKQQDITMVDQKDTTTMTTMAVDAEEDDTVIFNSSDSDITLTPEDDEQQQRPSSLAGEYPPSFKKRFKQALRISAPSPSPPPPMYIHNKAPCHSLPIKGILKQSKKADESVTTSNDDPSLLPAAAAAAETHDDTSKPTYTTTCAKTTSTNYTKARRYKFIHRFWRHQPQRPRANGEPKVRYSKKVTVHPTYSRIEYNREPDPCAACIHLTPEIAHEIRSELNVFKCNEMQVHPASRVYTHFLI